MISHWFRCASRWLGLVLSTAAVGAWAQTATISSPSAGSAAENGNVVFTVSLGGTRTGETTVGYKILKSATLISGNRDATFGIDFVAPSDPGDPASKERFITIPLTTTSGTINFPIASDGIFEGKEQFDVEITSVTTGGSSGTIGSPKLATGIITDDEAAPVINFASTTVSKLEGQPVTEVTDEQLMEFQIVLSIPSERQIGFTISAATATGGSTAHASSSSDFTIDSKELIFADIPAGGTANPPAIFTVVVKRDLSIEADEDYSVILALPTGGAVLNSDVSKRTARAVILNDDVIPEFTVSDPIISSEGGSVGDPVTADFEITFKNRAENRVVFQYRTSNGTATGTDFESIVDAVDYPEIDLRFASNLKQTIRIPIKGDEIPEENETFSLVIENAANAIPVKPVGTALIMNDDGPRVALSVVPSEVSEGDGAKFTVTASLLGRAEGDLKSYSVTVRTEDPIAGQNHATPGEDYIAIVGKELQFAPNQDQQPFDVIILQDTKNESQEQLRVVASRTLANPGFTLINDSLVLTIKDDDIPSITLKNIRQVEGAAGQTNKVPVILTIQPPSIGQIVLGFRTIDIPNSVSAIADSDYKATNGVITIPPNATSATLDLSVFGDATSEANEVFGVEFSVNSGSALFAGDIKSSTITIINDDGYTIKVAPVAPINEGDSGTKTPLFFNISIHHPTVTPPIAPRDLTVSYTTLTGGTAGEGTDFERKTGQLFIPKGASGRTFSINVIGDDLNEPAETIKVQITEIAASQDPTPITIGLDDVAIGTINNDDALPSISITGPAPITEGNEGAANTATIVFTKTRSSGSDVTVTYDVIENNSASALSDYTKPVDRTLVFKPSDSNTKTVVIPITGDLEQESDETFSVVITEVVNGTADLEANEAVVTIVNDDGAFISIHDSSVTREDAATLDFVIVRVNGSLDETIFVEYEISETETDSATLDSDYTLPEAGFIVLEKGSDRATLKVPLLKDGRFEPANETLQVTLSNPGSGVLIRDTAIGTIQNIDPAPKLTVSGTRFEEGSEPNTKTLSLTISEVSDVDVTFDYKLKDGGGTGREGVDYEALEGSGIITAGALGTTIDITVLGNSEAAPNKTFFLELNPLVGVAPTSPTSQDIRLDLINDDGLTISLEGPTSVVENVKNPGFKLTLQQTNSQPTVVSYRITPSGSTPASASDLAISGNPDPVFSDREVVIDSGLVSYVIPLEIVNDLLHEGVEQFSIEILTATKATLRSPSLTATITDDDAAPLITIGNAFAAEAEGVLKFPLIVQNATALPLSFSFSTEELANGATSGVDFTAVNAQKVTLNPEDLATATLSVQISNGQPFEQNEALQIRVNSGSEQEVSFTSPTAVGTILNDDGNFLTFINPVTNTGPVYSLPKLTFAEGTRPNAASAEVKIPIYLATAASQTILVEYQIVYGNAANSASADDVRLTQGLLTFKSGETMKEIPAMITGDSLSEPNEVFSIQITSVSPSSLITTFTESVEVTIQNDDNNPNVLFTSATNSVDEGQAAKFTIALESPSSQVVKVRYQLVNGSATAGADFDGTASTAVTQTFEVNGPAEFVIPIPTIDDSEEEQNETFGVRILSIENGQLKTGNPDQINFTILNNDGVVFSINDPEPVLEGAAADDRKITFNVTLARPAPRAIVIPVFVGGGTATASTDYRAAAESELLFAKDELVKTVTVTLVGDALDEDNETVVVTLGSPTSGTVFKGKGTSTIANDDVSPTLVYPNPTLEIVESGGVLTVPLRLNGPSGRDITIGVSTKDGSTGTGAMKGEDFVQVTSKTVVFKAGSLAPEQEFQVAIVNDALAEQNEHFFVSIDPTATRVQFPKVNNVTVTEFPVMIINDDGFVLSIQNAGPAPGTVGLIPEGDSVNGTAYFRVSVSRPAGDTSVVLFRASTIDGTAISVGEEADFERLDNVLFAIPGSDSSVDVPVKVFADTQDEPGETFSLKLSTASSSQSISRGLATATIEIDDQPTVSLTGLIVEEGQPATIGVNLSAPTYQDIVVSLSILPDTAKATDNDYTVPTPQSVTIPKGSQSAVFTIPTVDDSTPELNETFGVRISGVPNNAAIVDPTTVTVGILNNDGPAISLNKKSNVVEPSAAGTEVPAAFEVSIPEASSQDVTVFYQTFIPTGITDGASPGSDFVEVANGSVVIPARQLKATFNIRVLGDDIYEGSSERFGVRLTDAAPAGFATILKSSDVVSIAESTLTPQLTVVSVEANEPAGTNTARIEFTVSAVGKTTKPITFNYATSDGTAEEKLDYTATSGSATITPGGPAARIFVPVLADGKDEDTETVKFTVSNATNSRLPLSSINGIIRDVDVPPSLSVMDVPLAESGEAKESVAFKVKLNTPSGRDIVVGYRTVSGTGPTGATEGSDFVSVTNGFITLKAGEVEQSAVITLIDDALDENNETFSVVVANNVELFTTLDAEGVATIVDNDELPKLSITDASSTEGGKATFTVTLVPASGRQVAVGFSTGGGTATPSGNRADYTPASGTLTFPVGITTQLIEVTTLQDNVDETDESYTVTLGAPATNADIVKAAGTGVILDNDDAPIFSITGNSVTEGNTTPVNGTVTVSLVGATEKVTRVKFASIAETGTGIASVGTDYTAVSDTLVFQPGETTKPISIAVLGDTLNEDSETVRIRLSEPEMATIASANAEALLTIVDNDPVPTVTLSQDVIVSEGAADAVAVFTATLGVPSGRVVTVDYNTVAGTAAANADYTASTGRFVFPPGNVSQSFSVPILNDTADEADERFTFNLSNPVNVALGRSIAQATIADDDLPPTLTLGDVVTTEGNSGTSVVTLSALLSAASERLITVNFSTAELTAKTGIDFVGVTGTLTFSPGITNRPITITINGDTLDEDDETFNVLLSAPSNVTLFQEKALVTITDNDAAPNLSIADTSVTEGNSGTVNAQFTLTLSAASGRPITVDYTTADGTAKLGDDYTKTTGTLTIPAGLTTQTLNVPIIPDLLDEPNETFALNLSAPVGATLLDGEAVGTITDDDAAPSLSIRDLTVTEGDSGSVEVDVTVELSAPSGRVVSVAYSTADGSAKAGSDYTVANSSISFEPGVSRQFIKLTLLGDTINEIDESFFVNISTPVNATLNDSQAVILINDNDLAPTLTMANVSVVEGQDALFVLKLSGPSGKDISINFATAEQSAKAGADFVARSGTLVIPAGVTSATINIATLRDSLTENAETFALVLSTPVNVVVGNSQAIATIVGGAIITFVDVLENGNVVMDFTTESGRAYVVEFTSDFVNYTSSAPITASGPSTRFTDNTASSAGRRFYRIRSN